MKIALVGDSHAAMLIAAFRADPADDDLTVFAKPGLAPEDCRLDCGTLHAISDDFRARLARSGAPDNLQLTDFDAVVIAGVAPSVFAAVRLSQGHAIVGWPSGDAVSARVLRGAARAKDRPLMSRTAYLAALTALTQTSLAAHLIKGLREVSDAPAIFVPQPFPSERLLKIDGKYPVFRRIVKQGDGTALARDMSRAHRAGLAHLPGVTVLEQPDDTRRHGCLSAADLMRAGPRLSDGTRQAADDILHGNAELGARFLADLRAATRQDSVKSASNR